MRLSDKINKPFNHRCHRQTSYWPINCIFVALLSGCGNFGGLSQHDFQDESHTASSTVKSTNQTIVSETASNILVKLVAADSDRLMKSLGVTEKLILNNRKEVLSKSFATEDGSLSIACLSARSTHSTANCIFKIAKAEGQTVTSIKRDALKLDQSITIGSTLEAKKLYESLQLKEWDLGESKLIRFASFDSRFILECSRSLKTSRCQIFLSDGRSDTDSSQDD